MMKFIRIQIKEIIDDITINLTLTSRITFLIGNSGVGKSFFFEQLRLLAASKSYNFIKCLNYFTPEYEEIIKKYSSDPSALIMVSIMRNPMQRT